MGYPQFDMKFSQRKPPKLTKSEIDAMYMQEGNNGRTYVPYMDKIMHISDWRLKLYEDNGIIT